MICVDDSLVEEVHEITETVEQLRAKLRELENALQQLVRTKMSQLTCTLHHVIQSIQVCE